MKYSAIGILIFLFVGATLSPPATAQVGDIAHVHDPSIIQSGDTFYLFATGFGIPIRTSRDLYHWRSAGSIFAKAPAWTSEFHVWRDYLWAADISFFHGEYHVYYAASTFGSTHSGIGLATNKTLDSKSPDYHWVDHGKVIQTPPHNNWNAIDPCLSLDAEGQPWLVCGSCWTGIKIFKINPDTGMLADPHAPPVAIAGRPGGGLIEEGYIRQHNDYYYLWVSFDHCCRGVNSDYRIMVGRSKNILGPFIDRDGKSMLTGGGTQILASQGSIRGPGSSAIIHAAGQDWLVHHFYDGDDWGIPKLQIRLLTWDSAGWPHADAPITGPVVHGAATTHP